MNKFIIIVLIGVLLAGCAQQSSTPITHVYAFGDEQTDNGHCVKYLQEAIAQGQLDPDDLHELKFVMAQEKLGGRLTNGPVAVEVLADRLKVPLTDYAICMALSSHDSLADGVDSFANSGLLGQVDQFEEDLNGKQADPDAIYYIQIGSADFFAFRTSRTAETVRANISDAVSQLAKLGVKHILVGNSYNLSKFPGFRSGSISKEAESYQKALNDSLPVEMKNLAKSLNAEINIFDLAAIENRIQSDPGKYGITTLTPPCTQLGLATGSAEICDNPDEYYFWGYYYPTRVVHQIIGEAMVEQVSK